MSNIGFMRNTVEHIEKLFNKYLQNTKIYPSSLEKEDYKNFVFQMERIHRYGEIENLKEYKELLKRLKVCDLTAVTEIRKAMK